MIHAFLHRGVTMVIDLNLDPNDGMQQEGHVSGNQQDYEENVSATHSHVHDYNTGKKPTVRSWLPNKLAHIYQYS